MESALNSRQRSAIRDEAAEWLLARKAGLDPERARQFARWLARSPEHLAEYHAMESLDRDLPLALESAASADELIGRVSSAQDDDDTVVPFVGNGRARRAARRYHHPWALAAAFAFVAVAVVMLWPKMKEMAAPQTPGNTYASELGQVRKLQLEDGFTLILDTDSQVVVRHVGTDRQVQLQRGRVLFDIRHDPARSIEVLAGTARVVDVGTKFAVYLLPDVVRVTVLEGEVEVSNEGISGTSMLGRDQQIEVVAGQALAGPATVDAARALSWSSGEIRFEGVSVQEAAAQVERYSARRIVVESPALRRETIHYTFRTGDVGAFLAFLRDPRGLGALVTEESDRIVVTSP